MPLSIVDQIRDVQRFLNTKGFNLFVDGVDGPKTWDAIHKYCGLPATQAPGNKQLRVCIDPGHGMGNKVATAYDPGCVFGDHEEAKLVMPWAFTLKSELEALGAKVIMTRENEKDFTPLGMRTRKAQEFGADVFLSIHVNDADTNADGAEVQYNKHKDFAEELQQCLLEGMGLDNHTNDYRPDLTVLRFPGKCALLELGFIKNERDRSAITNKSIIQKTCKLLAQAITK